MGGYFVSYRKLEQWIAACRILIRFCPNLETLNTLWSAILQEAERYTEEAFSRLEAIWQQRQTDLVRSLTDLEIRPHYWQRYDKRRAHSDFTLY